MTITRAVAQLAAAFPRESFSISLDVWSHVHSDAERQPITVEWSVWANAARVHYNHPTLEGAVAQALAAANTPPPVSLIRDAEASVEGLS